MVWYGIVLCEHSQEVGSEESSEERRVIKVTHRRSSLVCKELFIIMNLRSMKAYFIATVSWFASAISSSGGAERANKSMIEEPVVVFRLIPCE
jgi:hypothetical protein